MRKLLLVALTLFVSLFFISCDNSKDELRKQVEQMNRQCPIDLGIVGKASSIELNEAEDEVIYTITLGNRLPMKISALNQMKSALKRSIISNYAQDETMVAFAKAISKADAKLSYVYESGETNESTKITLSSDELKDIADGHITPISSLEQLQIEIMSTNAQCPMQIDQVTLMTSVTLEGKRFVYNYSIDERYISLEQLEAQESVIKSNIKTYFISNDPSIKRLVKLLKDTNSSVEYRYVGNITGTVYCISIPAAEI